MERRPVNMMHNEDSISLLLSDIDVFALYMACQWQKSFMLGFFLSRVDLLLVSIFFVTFL